MLRLGWAWSNVSAGQRGTGEWGDNGASTRYSETGPSVNAPSESDKQTAVHTAHKARLATEVHVQCSGIHRSLPSFCLVFFKNRNKTTSVISTQYESAKQKVYSLFGKILDFKPKLVVNLTIRKSVNTDEG